LLLLLLCSSKLFQVILGVIGAIVVFVNMLFSYVVIITGCIIFAMVYLLLSSLVVFTINSYWWECSHFIFEDVRVGPVSVFVIGSVVVGLFGIGPVAIGCIIEGQIGCRRAMLRRVLLFHCLPWFVLFSAMSSFRSCYRWPHCIENASNGVVVFVFVIVLEY